MPHRLISPYRSMLLLALVASPPRGGAMAFRISLGAGRARRALGSGCERKFAAWGRGAARRMSAAPNCSRDGYQSMKVAELRDLLKENGLAVSGIKAQLVDRLLEADVEIKEGPKEKPEEQVMEVSAREEKNRMKISGRPRNLVYAKEEEEDDDDDWDDVDDDDFEDDEGSGVGMDGQADPNKTSGVPRYRESNARENNATFREDFLGTRVFVQGLPYEATWKDLKDHFEIAGEVVYASVSIDRKTGLSKQCGIVQFETPAMAQKAIREMRNHPLNGEKLYVRKDVQESRKGNSRERGGGPNGGRPGDAGRPGRAERPPTEWKRANNKEEDGAGDNWYNLRDDELKEIESMIEKRDKQRRQKNFKMSDELRETLKHEFGVHLDDTLKLWWTDTKHGGVPSMISDIRGEGQWGKKRPWRQVPTDPKSDAMVDSDAVMDLLQKRDKARRRQDFKAADALLERAHDSPRGGLGLRIHDESRTWRIWTERPPPRKHETPAGYEKLTAEEMCLRIVKENEPDKEGEMKILLKKFPGREWNIFKRLKERYK